MLQRRRVLQGLGGALAFAVPGLGARSAFPAAPPYLTFGLPTGVYDTAVLDALPGKQPLIKLAYRPPNYETPVCISLRRSPRTTPFLCATISPTSLNRSMCRAGGCGLAATPLRTHSS